MNTTFLFIVLSSILLGFCNGQDATENELRLYDSQVDFRHFEYTLNPDNSLKSMSNDTIVNTTFPVKIIENQFIKVTLLPSFGGRILSIIYKPTGKELLYQNPVGTPYGIGEGNFYYDFLMVYGGIFPTFSEPEQGKTWGLPWEFQVISNTDEQISIEMSFTDNIEPFQKIPPRFNNASTGITCVVTISVQRDSSAVRYDVKLTNNRNEPVFYEYWTCMTFAPGSAPGDTKTTAGTEMVIPMDQVMLKTWASWLKNSEQPIDLANGIFKWENLRWWKNWKARGIGYAYPSAPSWYGVLNHDNQEGVLRISQDTDIFPGLKIWTWGYNDSIATIPEKAPQNSRRPYIELWSGHGHEFFKNLPSMSPLQVKSTTEYFIPTVGLEHITSANQNAAVFLDHEQIEDSVTFIAQVFATQPNRPVRGSLKLVGPTTIDVGVLEWTTSATSARQMEGSVLKNVIPSGRYECQFELYSEDAQVLLQATVPYEMQ